MAQRPNEHVLSFGRGIQVTTHGPGRLHLYTYAAARVGGHYGFLETHAHEVSRFVIGKSYDYTHFAFFWDGKGKAEYSVGELPQKHPVGKSWATSSFWNTIYWYILPVEVTGAYFRGAVNNGHRITCYHIPDDFLFEEEHREEEHKQEDN